MIAASIGIFFWYVKPTFSDLTAAGGPREQVVQYEKTLEQADQISNNLAKSKKELNDLNADAVQKLNKLLPATVDNVHLIIDISNIGNGAGLALKNVGIAKSDKGDSKSSANNSNLYDSVDLSFGVTTTYSNFLNFIQTFQKSLRLVDVTSISFSPSDKTDVYDFNVTIRTYYLK